MARHLQPRIEQALDGARVVLLHGARQCGKTTLAKMIASSRGGTYISLDDEVLHQAVLDDPISVLNSRAHPLVVDEIQRGGDRVVRAIKQLVDEEPTPGRFLLTGSTNFLTVPNISESLAGRVRVFRLWPLSEAELSGTRPAAVERWFDGNPGPAPTEELDKSDYLARACRGGYPEVIKADRGQRQGWFADYVETVVQRDIVELADIRRAASLPLLLRWAAALTSNQINVSDAARDLGISHSTVVSYLDWLQTVFLMHELPAWSRSLWPKAGRRPKFHLADTGLAASLLGVSPESLSSPTAPATGPLMESFAVNEIARQISGMRSRRALWHYRDRQGREVDLLIADDAANVVAVEIKATSSPALRHMEHLRWLRDKLDSVNPGTFCAGILLHTGPHAVSLDDRLHMRPISTLWEGTRASGVDAS